MKDRSDHGAWDFVRYFRRTHPVPTEQLIERIRARDWEGVRQRTATHPWDAQYRIHSGSNSTPLHLLCLYRAPYDVVKLVLDAHPGAVLATDREGWTPLHVAFLYGSDEETSLLLIQRGGPQVAAMQSRLCGSPLHVACRHGVSNLVLQELIQTNPSMVSMASELGVKPASLLWNEYAKNPANEKVVQEIRLIGTVDPADPGIAKFMDRIQIFLNAATGRDVKGRYPIAIHEIVAFQLDLDLAHVVPIAACMYPDQIPTPNDQGDLPLHIAASIPPPPQREFERFRAMDSVNVLVQSYPAASSMGNRNGQLPLHLALGRGRRTWNTGIRALVETAPLALMTRDAETHLYPFQLAASCEADDDMESLSTIYELLRAWPPVLQNCTRDMHF